MFRVDLRWEDDDVATWEKEKEGKREREAYRTMGREMFPGHRAYRPYQYLLISKSNNRTMMSSEYERLIRTSMWFILIIPQLVNESIHLRASLLDITSNQVRFIRTVSESPSHNAIGPPNSSQFPDLEWVSIVVLVLDPHSKRHTWTTRCLFTNYIEMNTFWAVSCVSHSVLPDTFFSLFNEGRGSTLLSSPVDLRLSF